MSEGAVGILRLYLHK